MRKNFIHDFGFRNEKGDRNGEGKSINKDKNYNASTVDGQEIYDSTNSAYMIKTNNMTILPLKQSNKS